MQRAGLTDDDNAVLDAELEASVAGVRWLEAAEAVQQATARTNRLLGRPIESSLTIDERPEQLLVSLRQTHYPSEGLLGYRPELAVRIAELEQRRAQTRLAALRRPPSVVDFSLHVTRQLRGPDHALGVALRLRLDAGRNPAQMLEAARLAGESQGRLRGETARIEAERRQAHAEREAAARARTLALESRSRLAGILEDLRKNQTGLSGLNASAKARSQGIVESQLQEAELRGIEASARLARAELALLELDAPGARATPPALADTDATLDAAIDRLVASDPEVGAAAGAARSVAQERAHQRPGLLAGVHLAGPFLGASLGGAHADAFISAGI